MTHQEIKDRISEALKPDAVSICDQTGASAYDDATDLLTELSRRGISGEIVDVLVELYEENPRNDVEWWLRFLNLFDSVRQISLSDRVRISEAFVDAPPEDPTARAYVLRFLAYSGCPISWEDLEAPFALAEITSAAPLVLADAYVWAEKYDDALDVVSGFLNQGGSRESIETMIQRWVDLEGHASPSAFIDNLRMLLGSPQFAVLQNFGREIREVPSTFKEVPKELINA